MVRLLRLGVGSFALTFAVAVGMSAWNATPRAPAAMATPAEVVAPAPLVAMVRLPARSEIEGELRVAPTPAAVESAPAPEATPIASLFTSDPSTGPWSPPDWFPEDSRGELLSLEGIAGHASAGEGPRVRAHAAFVYDVDSGQVLYEKQADERRPVASLTKVVSALSTLAETSDLTREVCIDSNQWPGWPGAHSYLNTGVCLTGWDLLGAALVASDNRAAFAFPAVSRLPFGPFVTRMNEVASDLGMDLSTFMDPAGVDDENLSTARDMTRAILAVSLHPVVGPVASAPWWDISETRRDHTRRLFSTNRLVDEGGLEFLAAKTGYTDTARYCFTAVVRTHSGRRVALSVLGAPNVRTRWADVRRILDWVEEQPAG